MRALVDRPITVSSVYRSPVLNAAAGGARDTAAQPLAAVNGRRFDAALEKLACARATTCDEAMPAVNQSLKDIK